MKKYISEGWDHIKYPNCSKKISTADFYEYWDFPDEHFDVTCPQCEDNFDCVAVVDVVYKVPGAYDINKRRGD